MELKVDEIFDRILKTCEIKTLKELSVKFGYQENWASNARNRNVIPWDVCFKTAVEYNSSIDYFIFGDEKSNKLDTNELKTLISEGLFTLIQLDMMTPGKDVKISTMANAITSEITEHYSIENTNDGKKAI